MQEQWKQVPGYEGIYEASNTGKIRTCEGKITYSNLHGARVWQSRELKGRGNNPDTGKRVSLWKDKKCKDYLFCRVIAAAWLDLDMEQKYVAGKTPTVNHKDGNRLNNVLDNLEVVSLNKNVRHAFETELVKGTKVCLIDGMKRYDFKSLSEASRWLGRNKSYVFTALKRGNSILSDSKGNVFRVAETKNSDTRKAHEKIIVGDEAYTLKEWSEKTGISVKTIKSRQARGWIVEDCVKKPKSAQTGVILECGGKAHSYKEWSEITGIPSSTIYYRVTNGWEMSKALGLDKNKE